VKPSVQDATHYDRIFNVWYKTGETIAHYWDYDKKGWARSAFEREDLENEGEIITARIPRPVPIYFKRELIRTNLTVIKENPVRFPIVC